MITLFSAVFVFGNQQASPRETQLEKRQPQKVSLVKSKKNSPPPLHKTNHVKKSVVTKKEIYQKNESELKPQDTVEQKQSEEENSAADRNIPDSNAIKSYKSYVLSRIEKKKKFPLQARKKNQEGKVRLHIVISPQGELLLSEIVTPCEHELLNTAALQAIKKSSPFKAMQYGNENLDFVFSINFVLK